ncbi:hypothetical protein E3P92_00580 [Wallemia ichthyophaga]|uniref:Protein SKT5 n=2 Tax=Wallemia ichthyophaga TaxID=245174 RepID=A0A4T0IGK5_WALIC|nr:Protein SKT5 [Wallemia ichthyophaga EXF-994]TIA75902.1 hypothetical protein E3P91_00269 [Wallemia ichthyophaga]EOQ99597.1 Protein SKT5 [Wallemia ichthyophaga EXF-994]TIA80573.1 hypothetical protein E3P98_02612 [Wallemia ichthyophaga]TIA88397.1 hypothetical protein E3P97_03542 [Wallemia ichthyophaga]TIA99187.1 hypothetical protein E3P95_02144 [Wallemia ichthyophaga]
MSIEQQRAPSALSGESFYTDAFHSPPTPQPTDTTPKDKGKQRAQSASPGNIQNDSLGNIPSRPQSAAWDQSWLTGSPLSETNAPAKLMNQGHLKPGAHASLLSHNKTLELYRQNARKSNDPSVPFELAMFQLEAAKELDPTPTNHADPNNDKDREELIKEATGILSRLSSRGHTESQYLLADCFSSGIGTLRGRQDFDKAFPLFVQASKHGHPDACYRAGVCLENGWGCRKDNSKATSFYKKAATSLHPGALYRLGIGELKGELGLPKRPKVGVKHLTRSCELATEEFPHALHEMAKLYEKGVDNVLFIDLDYSVELLAQAAELGYAPSAHTLGECYEYAKLNCPQDAALSIHYYNIAAQQDHRESCFALTAWYLVGSPGILPQSDTEAYLWAVKAAEQGLAKAMYAVGYFSEVGIGTTSDQKASTNWYKSAAENGDERAITRLKQNGIKIDHLPQSDSSGKLSKHSSQKECIIM